MRKLLSIIAATGVLLVAGLVAVVVVVTLVGMFAGEYGSSSAATSSQEATSTPSTPAPPTIGGLAPVDVYGNLEDRGFECSGPDTFANTTRTYWECRGETATDDALVEIYSAPDSVSTVQRVEVTYLSFDPASTDLVAAEFLGFVSTVPYDSSSPAEAKSWVEENVGANTETRFGEATYTLGANAETRTLEISNPRGEN